VVVKQELIQTPQSYQFMYRSLAGSSPMVSSGTSRKSDNL